MKKLFFALIALVAIGANAQNGVSNPYRFGQGEDSTRCIQSISIMNTNVKNKDVLIKTKEVFKEMVKQKEKNLIVNK